MIVVPHKRFVKKTAALSAPVQKALAERLRIFIEDPFNPLLHNHSLRGSLRNYHSINITGDYRLIYEKYDEHTVRLMDIGTHHELYGA